MGLAFELARSPNTERQSAAVTATAVVTHGVAEISRSLFYDQPWFHYLSAGPLGAIVNGRNRTFVSSINLIIRSRAEVDKLLVLVGKDHVAGVSESLMKDHGWRELPVPGQKAGY